MLLRSLQLILWNEPKEDGTKTLIIRTDSIILSESLDSAIRLIFFNGLLLVFLYYLITTLYLYCCETKQMVKFVKYCDRKSDYLNLKMYEEVLQDYLLPIDPKDIPEELTQSTYKCLDYYLA